MKCKWDSVQPTNASQQMTETVNPPGIHRTFEEGTGLPQESEIGEGFVWAIKNKCVINEWMNSNAQKAGDLGRNPGEKHLGLSKTAVVEALKSLLWS